MMRLMVLVAWCRGLQPLALVWRGREAARPLAAASVVAEARAVPEATNASTRTLTLLRVSDFFPDEKGTTKTTAARYFVGENATTFLCYLKSAGLNLNSTTTLTSETVDADSESSRRFLEDLWSKGDLVVHDREGFRSAVRRKAGVGEGEDQVRQGFERAKAVWDGLSTSDDVAAAKELLESPDFRLAMWGRGNKDDDDGTGGEKRKKTTTRAALQGALDLFKARYPYYRDACEHCNAPGTTLVGDVASTHEERQEARALRAELRFCEKCSKTTRFLRANAVRAVLRRGRGRCGEYAAAFAAVLLALDVETRWVYDSTDHVWTEARIDGEWLHVDPCEAALDDPLLYSQNWGKHGCIVIGFTKNGTAVDLTHKYYPATDQVTSMRTDMNLDDSTMDTLITDFIANSTSKNNNVAKKGLSVAKKKGPTSIKQKKSLPARLPP